MFTNKPIGRVLHGTLAAGLLAGAVLAQSGKKGLAMSHRLTHPALDRCATSSPASHRDTNKTGFVVGIGVIETC